ncbi:hypothetical protein HPB50_018249 [Hyalomma asiaticum]|uniref:Uncharacterized protein n=1 Tax=Hyalomma asiaticum TaxID=266040 RepID=A0ACB7SGT4_HYAAI|nr:hypothetical protein HPB50_018249 [Hyalomma asiaticum]
MSQEKENRPDEQPQEVCQGERLPYDAAGAHDAAPLVEDVHQQLSGGNEPSDDNLESLCDEIVKTLSTLEDLNDEEQRFSSAVQAAAGAKVPEEVDELVKAARKYFDEKRELVRLIGLQIHIALQIIAESQELLDDIKAATEATLN